jgi:hypothetical protein
MQFWSFENVNILWGGTTTTPPFLRKLSMTVEINQKKICCNYYTTGRFLTLKFRFQVKISDKLPPPPPPPMSDALLRRRRSVQSLYNIDPCSCESIWKSKPMDSNRGGSRGRQTSHATNVKIANLIKVLNIPRIVQLFFIMQRHLIIVQYLLSCSASN